MVLTFLFSGAIAPFTLMLSPVSLAAARNYLAWQAPVDTVNIATKKPCRKKRPPLRLM